MIIDGPNFRWASLASGRNIDFSRLLANLAIDYDFSKLLIFYDKLGNELPNSFYLAMEHIGFELVPVPMHQYGRACKHEGKSFKSSTDQKITIEVMKYLNGNYFDYLFFFTGDSDYRFLLAEIKKAGKGITIFSTSTTFSGSLAEFADQVIQIDQLERDSDLLIPISRHPRLVENPSHEPVRI